jgi:probable F420-dependent oxidoreductase
MQLPLDRELQLGFSTTVPSAAVARQTAAFAERLGYRSVWTGDHIAFPVPMLDPLLQLAQLAAHGERIQVGTCVYLLPLRHAVPVAKQVATLDHLCGGRLVFGVGVGGEFPNEYAACGVPVGERGARLSEAIRVLRALWTGEPVSNPGPFYPFPEVAMRPRPVQSGGPPIWCGGRAEAALRRMGRQADGWLAYVVTPERYRDGLIAIEKEVAAAGRPLERFGTGHMLFTRVDRSFDEAWDCATEHLSRRYAMDFRAAARRYAALGRPEDVAERVCAFFSAGVRHLILDPVGPPEDRDAQLEWFASEVRPLLQEAVPCATD